MERMRKALSFWVTLVTLPVLVVVAILLAVVLAAIFYVVNVFNLVRTISLWVAGRFFSHAPRRDNVSGMSERVPSPSRALVDS
jgi:hypothetical protein